MENTYEKLMNKSDKWTQKAIETKDALLSKFYYNAAIGFEIKARKLKLSQVRR